MLVIMDDPAFERFDQRERTAPCLLSEALLFEGEHEVLHIGVGLGIVVAREGLMDAQGATSLHEDPCGGLPAVVTL
jgi:hypothetical protein